MCTGTIKINMIIYEFKIYFPGNKKKMASSPRRGHVSSAYKFFTFPVSESKRSSAFYQK